MFVDPAIVDYRLSIVNYIVSNKLPIFDSHLVSIFDYQLWPTNGSLPFAVRYRTHIYIYIYVYIL